MIFEEEQPMKGKALLSGDPGGKLKRLSLVVFIVLAVAGLNIPKVSAIELLASGMSTPETISPAKGAYEGSYDGYYFVPDPGRTSGVPTDLTNVWKVNKATGVVSLFSHPTNTTTTGGLFLPDGWGDYSYKFMTVGWKNFGTSGVDNYSSGFFNVYNSDGSYTTPLILQGIFNTANYLPKTPVLAPAGWGSFAGNLLIADGAPAVYAIDSSWNKRNLITSNVYPELARFGLAFAPEHWGTAGGKLMTSSELRVEDEITHAVLSITGRITAVDSSGTETKWAEFPIPVNLNGLRQMAFTPDGFLPGQHELLLVSVSGSHYGGGTLGDIWAFNSDGALVAELRDTLDLEKFDPRGLYFEGDTLLVSDASDPIWILTSADFRPVPIPPSVLLFGPALVGMLAFRRKRG
jgi:hypothetical protein